MARRRLSTLLFALGLALVLAALGQYGFMALRQRQLLRQWNQLGAPVSGAAPSRYAPGLRLIIPGIHLDAAVVRGTSYRDLLIAPGLLAGSALPGGRGNTIIAGHRDTFFRHLNELHPGDAIEVQSRGRAFDYRVTGRAIVKPSDTWVLANTRSPRLTLVTCYPTYWLGPAPDRLIVTAAPVR
ncbi:MAG: class D sortase [Terriglobales bacterium]